MLRSNWNYRRGDIYLADLGAHRGHIQGGIRPVINIQNNSGSFFGPTLIVVPLTTELKKLKQPTHYVLKQQRGLKEPSMSEAEQIVTINRCAANTQDLSNVLYRISSSLGGLLLRTVPCL